MVVSKIGEERFKEILKDSLAEPPPQAPEVTPQKKQPKDWKDLQTKVKEIYSNLGCEAQENVVVGGGKTKHQIDVLATFVFGGQKYRTVVECKYWASKVKKGQVGSLISVLADIGAEKGIIVSKMGFQSGAHKLATFTNIDLLTYDELLQKSAYFIDKFKIHESLEKIRSLRVPLAKFSWNMKKEAEKNGLSWFASHENLTMLGILVQLQFEVEFVDLFPFPRVFTFGSISQQQEKSKIAVNRTELLDLVLENLKTLESEYAQLKNKIFLN